MTETTVHILIASARPIERAGLASLFKNEIGSIDIVETNSQQATRAIISRDTFAMVVIDRDLPGFGDLSELSELQKMAPGTAFLLVGEAPSREMLVAMLTAGAQGYLPRGAPSREVKRALENVLSGHIYFPPITGSNAPKQQSLPELSKTPVTTLFTGRQLAVLVLMADGGSNKVIGRELGITENTVKIHLSAAFRILGVHTRQCAIEALRHLDLLPNTVSNGSAIHIVPDARQACASFVRS